MVRAPRAGQMGFESESQEGEDRNAAVVLFQALNAAKEAYQGGERDAEMLRSRMKNVLEAEPRAQIQYVSCADYNTLEELEIVKGKALLSMALLIGKTRLIDNFVLEYR